MIIKELDPFEPADKYERAGRRAEEQIAHYLKRFFGKHPDIDVINGLRIEHEGDFAQMDHLVIHPNGMVIVESKSVAGKVQIKDDGQWVRWYDNQSKGMRSPITQASMQSRLLKDFLNEKVRQKGFFDRLPIELLVAISDDGLIIWPQSGPLSEVCKADQIPERIEAIIRRDQVERGDAPRLKPDNRSKVAGFLCKVHTPLTKEVPISAVAEPVKPYNATSRTPAESPLQVKSKESKGHLPHTQCKHCSSTNVQISYGQYGYYFKCRECEKNTALKFSCPACGGDGRMRKQGNDFFAECKQCSESSFFFRNAD